MNLSICSTTPPRLLMDIPEQQWWQAWMDGLMDNAAATTHPLSDDEASEIASTLKALIAYE